MRAPSGGKKITGLGRHLAVDAEGWVLALVVTAAAVSDKAIAKLLIIRLFDTPAGQQGHRPFRHWEHRCIMMK
ncbi:MAG: hypothetical protein ACYCO9_00245 [Streptosporangiaceae bacterium]